MNVITLEEAIDTLKNEIQNTTETMGYGHSWYCNLKMACMDELPEDMPQEQKSDISHKTAVRFMSWAFETKVPDSFK